MIEIIVTILFLVVIIGGMYFLLNLYMRLIMRLQERMINKRIAKGKISDEKLKKYYASSRQRRRNTVLYILVHGPFYKLGLKQIEHMHKTYEKEMVKRNLL